MNQKISRKFLGFVYNFLKSSPAIIPLPTRAGYGFATFRARLVQLIPLLLKPDKKLTKQTKLIYA